MDRYYVVRNPSTGLVLDGAQSVVSVQQPTGFSTQLWKLEHVECGRFYISNKGVKEKVLDIERGGKKAVHVLLNKKESKNINQNWYINSDGTIVCANGDELALDISLKDSTLIIYPRSGAENQKFQFCDS